MDFRKIKKLIDLVNETKIAEIEIREGEESVRITRSSPEVTAAPIMYQTPSMVSHASLPVSASKEEASALVVTPSNTSGVEVTSPMVGTMYRASSPDAKPFVEIGQHVKMGDTLCIIEAMKMFNPIETEVAGKVVACHVDSGQPVEFGEALFTIEEN